MALKEKNILRFLSHRDEENRNQFHRWFPGEVKN